MKTRFNYARLSVLAVLAALASAHSFGQNFTPHSPPTNSYAALLHNAGVTNLMGAVPLINRVLATPPAARSVPAVSTTNNFLGTFWMMSSPVPLPGNFSPALPVYTLNLSNHIFLHWRHRKRCAAGLEWVIGLRQRLVARPTCSGFADDSRR